jgi:Flp pilus assembly protein TadD
MEPELKEAARLYAAGDWRGALAALAQVDSTQENHLDLAYYLGLCHARLSDWDEALLFLEQVVTASEDFLRVGQCRLALAYVYSMTGRSKLAEYELDQLLKIGYRSVQVLAALGHTSWKQGYAENAENWYAAALDKDPENPSALNGLGYVLASEGKDSARALTLCRKAVDRSPRNAAYLDSLGWAYHALGFEDEARDYIARALALAPQTEEIREHARVLALEIPPLAEEW